MSEWGCMLRAKLSTREFLVWEFLGTKFQVLATVRTSLVGIFLLGSSGFVVVVGAAVTVSFCPGAVGEGTKKFPQVLKIPVGFS